MIFSISKIEIKIDSKDIYDAAMKIITEHLHSGLVFLIASIFFIPVLHPPSFSSSFAPGDFL